MLPSKQSQSAEAKAAIDIFRAVSISRKQPATVRQLMRDYFELIGTKIDCQKFGYTNLEDFLVHSGEFNVHNFQGEMYLTARPNQDSNHLKILMKGEKKSKYGNVFQFREPKISDQSWNKSSYSSNVYQKLSPSKKHSPKLTLEKNNNSPRRGDTNNNNNQGNRNAVLNRSKTNPIPTQAGPVVSPTHKSLSQSQPQSHRTNLPTDDYSLSAKMAVFNLQERFKACTKDSIKVQTSAKTHQSVPNNTQNDKQIVRSVSYSGDARQQHSQQRQQQQQKQSQPVRRSSNDNHCKTSTPALGTVEKMSIQDRLKICKNSNALSNLKTNSTEDKISPQNSSNSSNSLVNNSIVITKEPEKTKITEKPTLTVERQLGFEFNPNLDAVTSLIEYCTVRQYELPVFNFFKSSCSRKIHGRVLVNGATYTTYPDEFNSESSAKLASAVKAIEEIKIQEARKCYPMCMDSDVEIGLMIYQVVQSHPNGIFHKKIPEMFEKTYEKSLPDNWFSIVQDSNLFSTEKTLNDNFIVFVNEEATGSSAASIASDVDTDVIIVDRITLPWETKYWNLYITYCSSTIEVWARIVDKGYNDKLDALMNDIDVHMLTDKIRPNSIICGQIYLISMNECWQRVRVEQMKKETGECLCFFIDFGDEEWQSMEQLYLCQPQFLLLPPQAICFSLFGLEDFAENPNARKHLNTLVGRSFVGEVLTKREDYEKTTENDITYNNRIQIALYDTSTNEDINLNPVILNQICDDTQPPKLKRFGVTNACVTHVLPNGELFIQVRSMELQYVQKLVHQLVESKFKEDQHKVSTEDMKAGKLFFVQDPDDNRWYRGTISDIKMENQISQNVFNLFYIDFGITKQVPMSRIFRLDSLSAALSKFPRQAIKVKMNNLPPINEKVITLIRGLLPPETPVIIKVATVAVIPLVTVYKRFDDKEGLFNVNESIHIQYELENSSETNENQQTANNFGQNEITTPVQNLLDTGARSNLPLTSRIQNLAIRQQITVPNSSHKDLQKLIDNANIPGINEYFDVIVTMASNPSNFIVRPYKEGPKLAEMMEELKAYCSSNDEFIPVDMIEVGQAYAAYNNKDGYYYRIIVTRILKPIEIHVYYCDFGGVAVLSNDKFKTLPAKCRTLPKQAIAAKLSDVKPVHGDWTLDDCLRFRQLTVEQKFVSIITKIIDDPAEPGSRILELKLIDVQTDEDIYIHDVMIKEGRAFKNSFLEF